MTKSARCIPVMYFSVLDQLGFRNEIYAMQSEDWFYNTTGAKTIMIREELVSKYQLHGSAVTDSVLIDEMDHQLNRHKAGKRLYLLHTKGSHYLYSQRYPRSHAKYQPECMGIDDGCSKEELINAYDNSILFIDDYLTDLFDLLRDRKALVFFVPDHGETIEEGHHFHATPRSVAPEEQFRIPVMAWASDEFLKDENNRTRFEAFRIASESDRVFQHTELYDTLLGCIGFASDDGGIVHSNNWCSDSLSF